MHEALSALEGIGAVAVFFLLLPYIAIQYGAYRGEIRRTCPEAGDAATIRTSAGRGVLVSFGMRVQLPVLACSKWPERAGCAGGCLP